MPGLQVSVFALPVKPQLGLCPAGIFAIRNATTDVSANGWELYRNYFSFGDCVSTPSAGYATNRKALNTGVSKRNITDEWPERALLHESWHHSGGSCEIEQSEESQSCVSGRCQLPLLLRPCCRSSFEAQVSKTPSKLGPTPQVCAASERDSC